MTVETDTDREQYATNATTGPWTVNFYFLTGDELAVTYTDAAGVDTLLELDVDYSVVGAGDEDGGTITTVQAYPVGGQLVILRDMNFLQETEYEEGDGFPAKTHERALDRLTMIAQQLREMFGRAVTFPASFSGSTSVGDVATRAGKLLGFDQITGAITWILASSDTALGLAANLASSVGATLSGYLAPYTGSRLITQADFNKQWLNVLQFGPIGTADDTLVLNIALAAAHVTGLALFIPPGTMTVTPITMPSDVTLHCHPQALIKAKTGYGINDRLLNFNGAKNITIEANGAAIQMLKSEYTTGEQRHAVFMINSADVRIRNLRAIDSGGDGFYIGRDTAAGTHCKRIRIEGCYAGNNRRQGMSIVSAEDVWVNDCAFEGTTGTDPQCGLDIEPNDGQDVLRNINVRGLRTSSNSGGGILVALRALATAAGNTVSIDIDGHVSVGDGTAVVGKGYAAFSCVGANGGAWANVIGGTVRYNNFEIINPNASGIRSSRWDAARAPQLRLGKGSITNPGSGTTPAAEDMCGVVIWSQDAGGADWGNISSEEVRVYDTRATPATYSPLYIYGTTGLSGVGQAKNVHMRDVVAVGFTPTSGRGHSQILADTMGSIEFTDEQVITDFLSTDPTRTRSYAGYTVVQPAGGVIQLPRASLNVGLSWRFRQTTNATSMQLRPDSNDTIDYAHAQGSDLVLSRAEANCKLTMSAVPGVVRADHIHDLAKRPGGTGAPAVTGAPGRTFFGSGPPTTGTWLATDCFINTNPASGVPERWVCATGGTPGIWVHTPNLV